MKFRFCVLIALGLFSALESYGSFIGDTSKVVSQKFTGSVASSFTNSQNWKGSTFNSLSVALNIDFNRMTETKNSNILFVVKTELGFTKFIDSLWNKHADKLNCNFVWKHKKRKIDHSCEASLTTQLLNSYLYTYDPLVKQTKSEWSGSLLNPATLDVGYGFAYSFWKNSMLNFSFATVRLKTEPIIKSLTLKDNKAIGRINRGQVFFDYGISAQALTDKDFTDNFSFHSTARFYMKGFNRESVEMDVSNKLNYKVWKWVQLRADIKMIYDPLISYKMQYRNELLFGVFYESEKKSD